MDTTAAKALVKAQSEMGAVIKNAQNPHLKNKYADLGAVIDACAEALHRNGFAILQPAGTDEHGPYVETVFLHESGERFASRIHLLIGKSDMQGLGSAQTYARRYGLLGMAGLAPEDDDGHAAVQSRQRTAPKAEPKLSEQAAAKEPARDPRKVADALIAKIGAAKSKADLDATLGLQKFDEAWEWCAAEAPAMGEEVRAAVEAARARLDPLLYGDQRLDVPGAFA